ncbi:MAG: hypothetical protein Q8N57_01215 [bacterium]|nr:hypothetical protein [bacterium]
MKKQVMKIKPADLKKATVRAFGRSAWEASKTDPLKGKIHLSKKRKEPKYKNRFHELEQ